MTVPQLGRDRSSKAGVDAIEHIWSVGYSSIPYAPRRRELAEDRLAGNDRSGDRRLLLSSRKITTA